MLFHLHFLKHILLHFIATTSQNCKDSKSAIIETDANDFFSSIIFPLRCTSILYEEKTQYCLVMSTGKYMTIKLMPVKSTICKTFDKPKFTHEKYLWAIFFVPLSKVQANIPTSTKGVLSNYHMIIRYVRINQFERTIYWELKCAKAESFFGLCKLFETMNIDRNKLFVYYYQDKRNENGFYCKQLIKVTKSLVA